MEHRCCRLEMACFAISCFSLLSCLIFLLICSSIHIALAGPVYVDSFCPDKELADSEYQRNIEGVLTSGLLSATYIFKIFYNISAGSGADQVYAGFVCRTDQTSEFCQNCISLAVNSTETLCHGKKESIVFYDQCLVRYSNESFYGILNDSPMTAWKNTSNAVDIQNITNNQTSFVQVLRDTLSSVSSQAAHSVPTRYATKEGIFAGNLTNSNTIYTLAQCTPDISVSDCISCLQMTIGNVTRLCQRKADCTVMSPNCNLMFDINAFYGDALVFTISGPAPAPNFTDIPGQVKLSSNNKKTSIVVGVTISVILVMVFLLGAWFLAWKRKSRKAFRAPTLVEEADEIELVESLKFDLTTIRKATNNFSKERKLGEGGFGEVYKGLLENGQYAAIKRLSSNSKQGISEFKTEVVLVAKLQHRNLVKFLGFCLTGKEKILVYEFLPNLSLDRFLSDPTRRASLKWRSRFNIIKGIARGLLYLHEDSRLRIVHRDLKPSNILLDETMNPKIGDFGMAKLFGVDQTQDNTDRIVGTFGYMAPEYVIAGHYSTKSDVYGFGIIILELVSGLKNKRLLQHQNEEESLVYQAWTLWNEESPLKLADPTFGNDFPVEELATCIHMGLLCVQENAAQRPPMASIVALLNGESITLPSPNPPCFLTGAVNETKEGSSRLSLLASGVMNDDITLYPR